MPDSKKLQVLKALTSHLEAINPTNIDPATDEAYVLDLRGNVSRGRTIFGESDVKSITQPLVSILEAPRTTDPVGVGDRITRSSLWQLLVQGFVKDQRENPTDPAYDLSAAVEMRLSRLIKVNERNGEAQYPEEYMLGGLVKDLRIGEGIVRPSDPQVSPTAFFYLPVGVELVTDLSNPYAA